MVLEGHFDARSPTLGLHHNDLFQQRKQREFIPESKKDQTYWDRRRRNNEAAKRSREKRRINDMLLESRVHELNKENALLRAQLGAIFDRYGIRGDALVPALDDSTIQRMTASLLPKIKTEIGEKDMLESPLPLGQLPEWRPPRESSYERERYGSPQPPASPMVDVKPPLELLRQRASFPFPPLASSSSSPSPTPSSPPSSSDSARYENTQSTYSRNYYMPIHSSGPNGLHRLPSPSSPPPYSPQNYSLKRRYDSGEEMAAAKRSYEQSEEVERQRKRILSLAAAEEEYMRRAESPEESAASPPQQRQRRHSQSSVEEMEDASASSTTSNSETDNWDGYLPHKLRFKHHKQLKRD